MWAVWWLLWAVWWWAVSSSGVERGAVLSSGVERGAVLSSGVERWGAVGGCVAQEPVHRRTPQ